MEYLRLKFPNTEQASIISYEYDRTFKKAKEADILDNNKMLQKLRQEGIFTLEMQTELDNLEENPVLKYPKLRIFENKELENKFIEKSMIEIMTGERIVRKDDMIIDYKSEEHSQASKEMKRHLELSSIKNNYMKYTCEGLANIARVNKLVFYCVRDENNNQLWNSYKEFTHQNNKMWTTLLASKIIEFTNGLSSTVLRKISRSPSWRTRWISATKTSAPIFEGPISTWDTNKIYLCFWSNLLDSILSSYEPPEQFIMENDELLDRWLESKRNESTGASGKVDESKDGIRSIFSGNRVNPVKRK